MVCIWAVSCVIIICKCLTLSMCKNVGKVIPCAFLYLSMLVNFISDAFYVNCCFCIALGATLFLQQCSEWHKGQVQVAKSLTLAAKANVLSELVSVPFLMSGLLRNFWRWDDWETVWAVFVSLKNADVGNKSYVCSFILVWGGGVTAPCFIKPIYHSRLLNQWDAEESSVSTAARGENTSSRYTVGAPKQEPIKVSVTHAEWLVTGQFLLGINT